jgi:hypothetical protein
MRRLLVLVCGLTSIELAGISHAGNVWDGGGGNNNWTTGANWNSDDQPPANNSSITIVMAGTTRIVGARLHT